MKKEIERTELPKNFVSLFCFAQFLGVFYVTRSLHFMAAGCASSGQTMWYPPSANQTRPSLLPLGLNSMELLRIPVLPDCHIRG